MVNLNFFKVDAVFSLIFCFTDSTFNQENLENIVQEIDEWKFLGFLIGDRNSQDGFQIFCTEQKIKGNETCMMLIEWQKMHPYASWTLLYQALIKMNEKEMSQRVLTTFLSGLFDLL